MDQDVVRVAGQRQLAEVERAILEARVGRVDEDLGGIARRAQDALDAEDDVSAVYSNEDISDEDAAKYAG